MKKILFISTNDGSDTRINKEIKTLSKEADIIYIGIGEESENSFIKSYCHTFKLIPGKGRYLISRIKHLFFALFLLIKHNISSIHIINEQTYIFFYPFIFYKHIVLDLFDSIFLSYNKSGNDLLFLKRIIYAPVNKLIVTDQNRRKLLPDFLIDSDKVVVLENFPNYIKAINSTKRINSTDKITILYSGTLMKKRGSEILLNLVKNNSKVEIITAGWVIDDISKKLLRHKRVNYLGIIKQEELLEITFDKCDYIFSFYEPISLQNINASPNKIYDGIMCRTPIIINREVVLSSFIEANNIGIVVDSYYNIDYDKLVKKLVEKRNSFEFPEQLIKDNSWNSIEQRLIKAHNL